MIADCDLRTVNLIKKDVQSALEEMYGPILELELHKIKHEGGRVNVLGVLTAQAGERQIPFAIVMDRVDGPLDYFL
jgi:hypothetical protein